MKRRLLFLCVAVTVCLSAGCSMFVSRPKEITTGDDVVCILYKPGDFKDGLTQRLTDELVNRNYTVVTDNVKRAKFYHAADFAAVVYMAEYWAWHTPWHAKNYFTNNGKSGNILFVVTAGDPDVEIDRPFDAVTCTSKKSELETVYGETIARLNEILE